MGMQMLHLTSTRHLQLQRACVLVTFSTLASREMEALLKLKMLMMVMATTATTLDSESCESSPSAVNSIKRRSHFAHVHVQSQFAVAVQHATHVQHAATHAHFCGNVLSPTWMHCQARHLTAFP
ncbi:hypothetical protein ACLKA7_013239 [Drosophila subpalustris]